MSISINNKILSMAAFGVAIVSLVLASLFTTVNFASAQACVGGSPDGTCDPANEGYISCSDCANGDSLCDVEEDSSVETACSGAGGGALRPDQILDPNFGGKAGLGSGDLKDTIAGIIRAVLGFLGIIAVVIILFGGFKWMTAGGQEDKVGEAKKLMIAGVIGLVIVLSAFAIANFVISELVTATA